MDDNEVEDDADGSGRYSLQWKRSAMPHFHELRALVNNQGLGRLVRIGACTADEASKARITLRWLVSMSVRYMLSRLTSSDHLNEMSDRFALRGADNKTVIETLDALIATQESLQRDGEILDPRSLPEALHIDLLRVMTRPNVLQAIRAEIDEVTT